MEKEGIDFYPLPPWKDTYQLLKLLPREWNRIGHTVSRFISSVDILWLRTPTPLLGLFLKEARRQGKLVVVHVASHIGDAWKASKHRGLRKLPVMIVTQLVHIYYRYLLRNQVVLATGPKVYGMLSGPHRKVYHFVDSLAKLGQPPAFDPRKTRNFLYVGRIVHRKGLLHLLSALKLVKDSGINASLTMVGTGPQAVEFKAKAKEIGISDSVVWRGYVPPGKALESEYRKAGILILPSEASEGYPRVVLEAWSYGLISVTSNVEGLNKIIAHGENGLLVPVADSRSLANALLELNNNRELCTRLIRGGYDSLKPFTFEKQLELTARVFEKRGKF